MSDILFAVFSCSIEGTRDRAFNEVSENITSSEIWPSIRDSTILFDNASTKPLTLCAFDKFQNIAKCERNVGYWSAVNWVLENYQRLVPEKKYIYIIESDCIHWSMEKIQMCRDFLEKNPDVGMVRTQEFLISQSHRFDKMRSFPDSTRWNRFRLYNHVKNEPLKFWDPDGEIYRTNFVPVLCGLNRIDAMKSVFRILSGRSSITEFDFQKMMFDLYECNAQLDAGIFNSSAGGDIIAGSRVETIPEGVQYKPSGHDTIIKDFKVYLTGERDGF